MSIVLSHAAASPPHKPTLANLAHAPAPAPAGLIGLADFVDGAMTQLIASRDVAGAVITVVYRDRPLFTHGYGFANVEQRVPIDPQTTLFRPGSISKLFTWTALMQQVESGRVNLDADVNRYLDFHIPDRPSGPILVRHLLSHSAGFEDRGKGMTSASEAEFRPLGVWLRDHIPTRVYDAGSESAYSNYGSVLAGYIVQRVSGEPFHDYIDHHIFRPLGMVHSSFIQPPPAVLATRLASGYELVNGRFDARPFELIHNAMPAGGLSTTAPDMARFMIAVLQDGRHRTGRLLKPDTAQLMQRDLLGNAPDLPKMAHGYMVLRAAGPRLIGHSGKTRFFSSFLVLAPEHGLGFFISMTGGPESSSARTEMTNAIIGRLYPQRPMARWAGPASPPPVGHYRTNRRDFNEPAKPQNDIVVIAKGDDAVVTTISGKTLYWERIGSGLYEQVTGMRAGGPYDRLQFYGAPSDPKLALASQPFVQYRLVPRP